MGERWATFDCYGTLVDWDGGVGRELARLFGAARRPELLAAYHEVEPEIQAAEPGLRYREVLARSLAGLAERAGLAVPAGEEDALASSLPAWPVFAEVPAALLEARAHGWRLCILSNTDRDLVEASIASIGVPFDASLVASEIGSYKPAPGHWQAFEQRFGRLPDVHVAASLFHDIAVTSRLGVPSVWINRLGEQAPPEAIPTRELPDLGGLAGVLAELAPA